MYQVQDKPLFQTVNPSNPVEIHLQLTIVGGSASNSVPDNFIVVQKCWLFRAESLQFALYDVTQVVASYIATVVYPSGHSLDIYASIAKVSDVWDDIVTALCEGKTFVNSVISVQSPFDPI